MIAKENPALSAGLAVSGALLAMRGKCFWVSFAHTSNKF